MNLLAQATSQASEIDFNSIDWRAVGGVLGFIGLGIIGAIGNRWTKQGNQAAATAAVKADTAVNVAKQSADAVAAVKTEITDPNGGSTLRGMLEDGLKEVRAAREEARQERLEAKDERRAAREETSALRSEISQVAGAQKQLADSHEKLASSHALIANRVEAIEKKMTVQ